MADGLSSPVLEVSGLTKHFGALAANSELSFDVAPASIHALIGPNGAGKTTAMSQIFGEIRPDSGCIRFEGADITGLAPPERAQRGLQRSYQITSLFPAFTAEDNVAIAVQARAGSSFRFWRPARADEGLRAPARVALEQVGLAERADAPVTDLAHGEQRQLELAMVLAARPRMLLLDEPMAGMGQSESRLMTAILDRLRDSVTILLVEHDMDVVFALADRITVLVGGQVIASDRPDAIRADARVRAAYLGDG